MPGDVHSALLNASLIPDPYYSTNEFLIQWVSEEEWTIQRNFDISTLHGYSAMILALEVVDTFATVYINGNSVLDTTSCFIFYRPNVLPYLKVGSNNITIVFHVAKTKASQRYFGMLPKSYPYSDGNNKIPFMNYIRSPQFHSGWDWGICLVPSGIYSPIELVPVTTFDLYEVSASQGISGNDLLLQVDAYFECFNTVTSAEITVEFAGSIQRETLTNIAPGKHSCHFTFDVSHLEKWTIHEFGKQPLYDLTVTLDDKSITKRVGVRKLVVDTHDDDYGTTFQFVLNDKIVNAKGANYIPTDAIPSRMTYEVTYNIIKSMVDSNMNIIRVWGGGYYPSFLYDICDELGVLVWQDFMFGCAQYPTEEYFLNEVEEEIKCQLLRNKHHASICLWCGDNEDFIAINWFSFTDEYKTFLKNEYKTFNQNLLRLSEKYDDSRRFWPSSPSDGTFDYDGEWTVQTRGDMHYWEVWHGRQPFESFFTIKPRFCSEFGYQSYPTLPTVKMYAPEDQWNIYSSSFDSHQKNAAGNELIANMFSHYFKEPTSFIQQLYLSQVQQAFAIRMGCEFWRTRKPYTRGIIYWQINDCWPVTSWSSIEYGGRWKQLQYHAKRFFSPVMPTFYEDKDEGNLYLYVVNDRLTSIQFGTTIQWIDFNGAICNEWMYPSHTSSSDSADVVWILKSSEIESHRTDRFFRVIITLDDGTEITNFFFASEFKNCGLKVANIKATVEQTSTGSKVTLTTNVPAFFVTLESDKVLRWSDNSFLLLPDEPFTVTCDEKITLDDLTIYQLGEVGN